MKINQKPTVTSLISRNSRRLVYVFEDGREMVEQYDLKTHQILTRKTKNPSTFKQTKWVFQIGTADEPKSSSEQPIIKANNAPIFLRKDTLQNFQWRIRNLPYPFESYILQIDQQKQEIIIKTTVKKYYKRFDIPDLKRNNIKLEKVKLSYTHKNNTLIISYIKPEEILSIESKMRKEFEKMNAKKPKQGDIQCTTQ